MTIEIATLLGLINDPKHLDQVNPISRFVIMLYLTLHMIKEELLEHVTCIFLRM
jgi:hypothetical protein